MENCCIFMIKLRNKLLTEASLISRRKSTIEDINNSYLGLLDNIIGFSNREDREVYDLVKFQDSLIKSDKINNRFLFMDSDNTLVLDLDVYLDSGFQGLKDEIYINFNKLFDIINKGNINLKCITIQGNVGKPLNLLELKFYSTALSSENIKSPFTIKFDDKKGNLNSNDDGLYMDNIQQVSPYLNLINIYYKIVFKSNLTDSNYRFTLEDPKKTVMNKGIRFKMYDNVIVDEDLKVLKIDFDYSKNNVYDNMEINKIIKTFKRQGTPLSYYFNYQEFLDYLLQYKGSTFFQNGHPYTLFNSKPKNNEMFIRLDKESESSYYINIYSKYYKNHKILYHSKEKNKGIIIYFF